MLKRSQASPANTSIEKQTGIKNSPSPSIPKPEDSVKQNQEDSDERWSCEIEAEEYDKRKEEELKE